jgi:vacuolar protein sorting-associated protein 13A/C
MEVFRVIDRNLRRGNKHHCTLCERRETNFLLSLFLVSTQNGGFLALIVFTRVNAAGARSAPFNIEDIGAVHLRVQKLDQEREHLIRADVKISGSSIFVTFNEEPNGWPFVLENGSDYTVSFYQAVRNPVDLTHASSDLTIQDSRMDTDKPANFGRAYKLSPHSTANYAWDYPAAREKKIMLTINNAHRAIDIMEIGDLVPFKFHVSTGQGGTAPGSTPVQDQQSSRAVSLDVRADGHQQILSITNYDAERSLYKPRRRSTGSLARSDTMSSGQEAFEAVTEEITPTLAINVDFAGIGLSLMNRKMVEVVYLSINALKFEYTTSEVAQAVTLACGTLQIDNQLHDAIFPVVLQPTPISKEAAGVAALPTVQASLIWLNDEGWYTKLIRDAS